jgi:hypothetical protein
MAGSLDSVAAGALSAGATAAKLEKSSTTGFDSSDWTAAGGGRWNKRSVLAQPKIPETAKKSAIFNSMARIARNPGVRKLYKNKVGDANNFPGSRMLADFTKGRGRDVTRVSQFLSRRDD